jgi:hypothetical protein
LDEDRPKGNDEMAVACDLPEWLQITAEEIDLIESHLRPILIEMIQSPD